MDFESILRAERLLAKQFNDAPRELRVSAKLAMKAIQDENYGDALNLLNRCHNLANRENRDDLKAEIAAIWAFFYFRTGDKKLMQKAIDFVQKKEPENKTLLNLLEIISDK